MPAQRAFAHRAPVSLLAIAIVASVIGVWLWRMREPSPADRARAKVIEQSQKQFAQIKNTVPLSNRDAVIESLANMTCADETIRGLTADFLFHRFGGSSPAQYAAWRLASGYQWASTTQLIDIWSIDKDYEYYFHKPAPEPLDLPTLFAAFWEYRAQQGPKGYNRAKAVAVDPEAFACSSGKLTLDNKQRQMISGAWSTEVWHGLIAHTMCQWLVPPRDSRTLLKLHGSIDYIEVGTVLSYEDNSKRAVHLVFLRDPADQSWYIHHLIVHNVESGDLSVIDY